HAQWLVPCTVVSRWRYFSEASKSRHANCLVDERVEAFSLPSAQRPEIAHVLPVAVLLDLCPKT
ncbi:MAG: hypothetical protein RR800_14125, partial [Comamonas sp.]